MSCAWHTSANKRIETAYQMCALTRIIGFNCKMGALMNRLEQEQQKRVVHDERLSIRLSGHQAEMIETLIDAGLYDTKVEFVRRAINTLLPQELKKADEKTNMEFEYLHLKDKLRALKEAKYQYTESRLREKDLLRR